MKKFIISLLVIGLGLVLWGIFSKARGNNPGIEYAPDMYYPKGIEAYTQLDTHGINPNGINLRTPVKGTVAQGNMGYNFAYENTPEGYKAAAAMSLPTDIDYCDGKGKIKFNIYCSPCHGEKGGNNGPVFGAGRLGKPVWPNYQDEYIKNLSAGQMYWVITYGKNFMGSHASMLKPADRWKVINYVKALSNDTEPCASNASTTAANNDEAISTESSYEEVEIPDEEQKILAKNLKNIQFETGSDKIKSTSIPSLDNIVALLTEHTDRNIAIEGHTDNVGKSANNKALSKARAKSVMQYLASHHIDSKRMVALGFGSEKPLVPNDSKANKQKNRRVEIHYKK